MTRTHRSGRRSASRVAVGALVTVAALVVSACAAAATPSPAPTAAPTAAGSPVAGATVKVAQHPSLGTYLTGPDGKALYLFTKDSRDTSTCTGQCAGNWPPLILSGSAAPIADTGVTGTLATITHPDAGRQITYNGVPLYYNAQDAAPGDTKGQGASNVWYLAGTSASAASGTITGGLGQGGAATAAPAPTAVGGSPSSLQIRNSTFPASTTVVAGTTVTWTNGDAEAHTVTADDGSFDSGNVAPGASFQRTFSSAATVKYHCAIHPEMTGTVMVTSAANVTY